MVRALSTFDGGFDMSRRDLGYVSGFTSSQVFANTYGTASGGTAVTISGVNYQYVAFSSTGSFTPTTEGLFDVMAFAGGGAGSAAAYGADGSNGGGGAGGQCLTTVFMPNATYTVTVGAGGAGGSNAIGTSGSESFVTAGVYAIGGGFGGSFNLTSGKGGSSGGVTSFYSATFLGSAISGQGNTGGYGQGSSAGTSGAGGGGGAGAVGGTGTSSVGGAGGAGYDVSAFIGGSSLFKAGGGGGGRYNGSAGAGGSSIGGAGGGNGVAGGSPAANTASGGGGTSGAAGGNGGSGIVYIRWKV